MQKGSAQANTDKMTSTKGNVWIFPEDQAVPDAVLKLAGGNEVIARLLVSRGYDSEESAREFLDTESYEPTNPMELPDVDKAVRRITEAIQNNQHITVYGDYDVDGITGTSVLLSVLRSLGADVDYYIPNRMNEGYGLNLKAVSILASKHKTKLIITCDCGVSNFSEINFAKSLGVDTLVLDHHTMPEVLPPAGAIVHPKRLDDTHPLFDLPGVGVAYKVCEALLQDNGKGEEADDLIDLVTMGMIADLVPLVRENRYIVRIGLTKLIETKRVGLKALLAQVRKQKSTDLVGFGIAPRLNAAGRLSDATKAVELLTTDNESVADDIAEELKKENTRRQELCETIFDDADRKIQADKELSKKKCIAIYDETWHHGVVGIVASRLVEKYHRPVFIGQLDKEEGIVKGSARGVTQIDLYEVLKENEHIMNKWGGHKMAAGFSCDAPKADELMKALVQTCNKMLEGKPLAGVVKIDLVVDPTDIDLELAKDLNMLAPYGMGNKKPRFCMKSMTVSGTRALGKEKKHSRIMFKGKGQDSEFESVFWNSVGAVPSIGQEVDVVFTPEVNHFNNRDRLQLVLADWRSLTQQAPVQEASEKESLAPSEEKSSEEDKGDTAGDAAAKELSNLVESIEIPTRKNIVSTKVVWKDLRAHQAPLDVLRRATQKLQEDLLVFAESMKPVPQVGFTNRIDLRKANHLILWQYPPNKEVFESILETVSPTNIYLIGKRDEDFDDPVAFLKRLYGLVRYAVNKKEGVIQGELITSLMASDKLAVALGLSVLRKANLVDWFAEEGIINLDLLGGTSFELKDCPEYTQLKQRVKEIMSFRNWCSESHPKDIQLDFSKNGVSLAKQTLDIEESVKHVDESENSGNANGKNRSEGIETSS